jgi:hypothetical protein
MKRIVNGVTYNTATSTMCAQLEYENKDHNGVVTEHGTATLYQTRGGAFFLHEEKTINEWNEVERETYQRQRNEFFPLSPKKAREWMLEDPVGDVEIINNPFGDDPPEATAEPEPGTTVYVRMPAALKQKIEEAAAKAGQSINVWMMRCAEGCVASQSGEPEGARREGRVGSIR